MTPVLEKDEAHRLIDRMPQGATWDDLMREIYVRETIKRGLADSNAGRDQRCERSPREIRLAPE
jgi:hypothetical protein